MKNAILANLVMLLALGAAACGGGGDGGATPDCEGVSTCSTVGTTCDGDVLTTCAADADGCFVESTEDCTASANICDDTGAQAVCVAEVACEDDVACDGASDGDSFCDGSDAVACTAGDDGCLDATVVTCDAATQLCDDTGAAAACVLTCDDHPSCVGASDGDLSCDAFFLNACTLGADGCLDLEQTHCGAALCEDATPPAACGVVTATGLDCGNTIPVLASGFVLSGTDFVTDFAGGTNLTEDTTCLATNDAGTVGAVLEVALQAGDTLDVFQTGAISTVISVQSTCAVDGACTESDDTRLVTHVAPADETVFVVVENVDLAPANGAYSIEVFINATCGNGAVEPGETCDDGNLDLGDGCDETCEPEFGFACDGQSPSSCALFESLGTYAAGETVTPLTVSDAAVAGTIDRFLITFSSAVFLNGTLGAVGTGDYDFVLRDIDGLVIVEAADGDEAWQNEFVPAGTYVIDVDLFGGGEDSDLGFALNMDTGTDTPVAVGAAGAVTATGLITGDDHFSVFTFAEDVDLTGTLTGTSGADFDLTIVGTAGIVTDVIDDGDETYNLSLQAGTYYFEVTAFAADQDDFSLDFTVAASALADIGTFAVGDAIADTVGGPLVARVFDHYSITFSEDVLLDGLLDGNTTGGLGIYLYDTSTALVRTFNASFDDVVIPAGTYIVQIQTFSDVLGGGDVDAYNLNLTTAAVPVI